MLQFIACKTPSNSKLAGIQLLESDASTILFYGEGEKVIIKKCKALKIVNNISDCDSGDLTDIKIVDKKLFRKRLLSVVFFKDFSQLNTVSTAGMAYKQRNIKNEYQIASNKHKRAQRLKKEKQEAMDFIEMIKLSAVGANSGDSRVTSKAGEAASKSEAKSLEKLGLEKIAQLEKELEKLTKELKQFHRDYAIPIGQVNKVIEQIFKEDSLPRYFADKSKSKSIYALLSAYLKFNQDAVTRGLAFKEIPDFYVEFRLPSKSNGGVYTVPIRMSEFYFGTTEVSQKFWVDVTGHNPSSLQRKEDCPEIHTAVYGIDVCPTYPVDGISTQDMDLFVDTINSLGGSYIYSLPTIEQYIIAVKYLGITNPFVSGKHYQTREKPKTEILPVSDPGLMNVKGVFGVAGNLSELTGEYFTINSKTSAEPKELVRIVKDRIQKRQRGQIPALPSKSADQAYYVAIGPSVEEPKNYPTQLSIVPTRNRMTTLKGQKKHGFGLRLVKEQRK